MRDEWNGVRNLLCVRLDNAGDVLMTEPALRALKLSGKRRSLTLLCSPSGAAAAKLIASVDRVIEYTAPWVKNPGCESTIHGDLTLIRSLAAQRFDAAVIFTVYSQNPLPAAYCCYLAGIPERAAFCRENPYRLLTRWIPDHEPQRYIQHEVRRQLTLAASLGASVRDEHMRIHIPAEASAQARRLIAGLGIPQGRRWLLVHPGATASSRTYPPGHFARVCDRLGGETIIFTGSSEEKPHVKRIRAGTRTKTFSLAGKTDICVLAALIQDAGLIISNNTCPVHLASATGTPVVDLYALTNPQHTPWKTPNRVLWHEVECRYCYKSVCPRGHHACLSRVAPDKVADAAKELLRENGGNVGKDPCSRSA